MFLFVGVAFPLVPFERYSIHIYIVIMACPIVKSKRRLFPDDLREDPFAPPAIGLAAEDLFAKVARIALQIPPKKSKLDPTLEPGGPP